MSRQAAFDHVYVLNATTVLNMRYGYNWFVRGTDTNPANHGFDLRVGRVPVFVQRADRRGPRRSRGSTSRGIRALDSAVSTGRTRRTRSRPRSTRPKARTPFGPVWIFADIARRRNSSPTIRPASSSSMRPGREGRSTTPPLRRANSDSRSRRFCSACRPPDRSSAGPATTKPRPRGACMCRTTGESARGSR